MCGFSDWLLWPLYLIHEQANNWYMTTCDLETKYCFPGEEKMKGEALKDKLASAMKERYKEKQLQAERKKKAAMFLNLLRSNKGRRIVFK